MTRGSGYSVAKQLDGIRALVAANRHREAEEALRELIASLDAVDLRDADSAISKLIGSFFPKRRRDLSTLFKARMAVLEHGGAELLRDFRASLRNRLAVLSDRHIFEWATYYREAIQDIFREAEELRRKGAADSDLAAALREEFATHSREIYAKGFAYVMQSAPTAHGHALEKSRRGLYSFLELPLEPYLDEVQVATRAEPLRSLRTACSAMLRGIVEGYGGVHLGQRPGWGLLTAYPEAWAHFLPFMTADDLSAITTQAGPQPLPEGVLENVVPVAGAVDKLLDGSDPVVFCIPVMGRFTPEVGRLEWTVLLPKGVGGRQHLEVHSYVTPESIHRGHLVEAARRTVALIVGPLPPDTAEWVREHDLLRPLVVNTRLAHGSGHTSVAQLTQQILADTIAGAVGSAASSAPLSYNFARDFPLHMPAMQKYFLVHRPTVLHLMRYCRFQQGIRLWCSVRRSGKTTACFELISSSPSSTVVTQTCESTRQQQGADLLYRRVEEAIHTGTRVPDGLLGQVVELCADAYVAPNTRVVLVIDEYETLFDRMRLAAARDPEVRYTVVQPLLNQMVAFSRENLLVLVGQRPDAHFIVMDQNQLSAYVRQDYFPLFAHAAGTLESEFGMLVRKVLDPIGFEASFADALFEETGGHPFLTVNVLVDLVDWLIAHERPGASLGLSRRDFTAFRKERLTPEAIRGCREYEFFKHFLNEAMGDSSRLHTPWLYAVCSIMRRMAESGPDNRALTRDEYFAIAEEVDARGLGYEAIELLSAAHHSNFLFADANLVRLRIPIMGRIAAALGPRAGR